MKMTYETTKNLLQMFPLFKGLTDEEIEQIVKLSISRTYRQGTHIFMQGDPLQNVYFIHEGRVKIYKTDFHGKEQIVNVLQSGDMFPHQGFFRQDPYPAHAESIDHTTIVHIPIHSFEKFLISYPEICVKIFRVLGDKIVDLQQRLEEQILHNTYEQIIMLLLRLSGMYGKQHPSGSIMLETGFTNQELANMIGSSRETVSRTINQLKKKKFVSNDEKGRFLIDTEPLENELF